MEKRRRRDGLFLPHRSEYGKMPEGTMTAAMELHIRVEE